MRVPVRPWEKSTNGQVPAIAPASCSAVAEWKAAPGKTS